MAKDKYLAELQVSTTGKTESDSDEASEIKNWMFDFSTSSAKPVSKKPKQTDARSTLVHCADKMFTSEQEKLNALLARAICMSVAHHFAWLKIRIGKLFLKLSD